MTNYPIRADLVGRQPVEWLWGERIPRGMISLVAGLPGVGKSLFGYFLAAEASKTGAVIYSTVEESLQKTARARLEAAGAQLDRVYFLTPELPEDTESLRAEIERHQASLVVLDPIAAHLSVSISVDQDVRRALSPLKQVAEDTNAAIVLVSHTVKRPPAGGHPMDAIGGAGGGLRAAARVAFLLGKSAEDTDEILLVAVKSNLGPEPASFAFELDEHYFDDVGYVALLTELGERGSSIDDARIMLDTTRKPSSRGEKRAAASEFIINYLRHGPRSVAELKEDAKQYKHAWATIRRAADELSVIKPAGGPNATWTLPPQLLNQLGASSDA
jgi:hypothetical protein